MNHLSCASAVEPQIDLDIQSETALEPPFTVFIHNDDVTPYDYVILILSHIFKLSHELAEHITWVAHTNGSAHVVTRPRGEAVSLVNRAHTAARLDGYPLTFTVEPEN
jgi:ATP-dependent Clp protease adaptor protein ClpS